MKRLKYAILLVFIILTTNSQGDVIITESRTRHNHKIINLTDYPDIKVFGVYEFKGPPHIAHTGISKVLKDGTIGRNIFCSQELFAVKKEYLENRKTKDIDWEDKKNVIKSNITIIPDNSEKANLQDIRVVEHSYKIAGFNDTTMVLYETKQVFKYKKKQPDMVQYCDYEGDLSKLHHDFK